MMQLPTCRRCGSSDLVLYRQVMVNNLEHCKYHCNGCNFKSYVDKSYLCLAKETIYSRKYIKDHIEAPQLFDYGIK